MTRPYLYGSPTRFRPPLTLAMQQLKSSFYLQGVESLLRRGVAYVAPHTTEIDARVALGTRGRAKNDPARFFDENGRQGASSGGLDGTQ